MATLSTSHAGHWNKQIDVGLETCYAELILDVFRVPGVSDQGYHFSSHHKGGDFYMHQLNRDQVCCKTELCFQVNSHVCKELCSLDANSAKAEKQRPDGICCPYLRNHLVMAVVSCALMAQRGQHLPLTI